ncbi:MAG TPA: hypothetical protein EYN89_12395, partial [Flavobacteriales bacterium]|nr:hypothetical protein [Flavobacteriales bacterium]
MAFPKKNLFTTLCKVISLIVFLSLALPRLAISQGIGINNTTPDASAILDLAATDRGLLVPRMTQNQKNAISSPATGLLIFQTDAPMGYYFYDSSAWIKLTSSSEATWTKSGNFVYNSSDSIGIGTATPSSKLYIDGGDIKIAQIATEDPYIIRSYSNSSSLWFMPANAAKTPKLVLADAHQWDRSVEIDYDAGTTGAGAGILRIGQISKNGTDFTHGITALYTKGTERIRITNDGNVGLGTSTPGTKFSILGAVSIDKKNETDTARLYFQRYANGGLNNKVGALIDWNNAGHLRFFTTHSQSSSGSEYGYFQFYMPDHSSSEFTINKWTAGNALGIAAGSSALFKVGNDGNVGIGTSSPSAKLEVNGQIKITGGSPGANKVLTSDADGLATWEAVPGAEDRQDSNISIAGWYRIAECTGGGKRANATFVLTDKISGGGHSTVTFKMGVSYNQIANSHFVLLSHSYYSTKTFTKIRLLTNTTYDEMYLEVYANRTGNVYSAIYHNHNTDGWNSVDWSAGSIPTGYTATEHSLEAQFAVGNNTESFFVSNDGNVGIGNTNPTARLEITEDGTNPGIILNYGGSNTFASVQGPSNRDLRFDLDGSGASDKFHFRNIGSYGTNSDLMVIRADTTVGIGTTSPTAGLDVFQKAIRARRDNDQYVEMVSNTASGSYLRGHSRETNQKPLYIENVYNTNGTGAGTLDIRFRIGNESSSTTVMTLEDDYQVGIGTIDPTELLHVAGNMRLTGTIKDVNNEGGTNGQVLTATGTGLDWLDASSLNDGDWTSNSPDIYNANTGGVAIGTSTNSQTLTGDLWADQSAITKLNIVIPSSNTTVDVGIHNELSSTTNTTNSLFAYGIYNKNSIASNNIAVGIYNKADSTSTGSRIGLLNYAYGKATTSNVVYGIYNTTNSRGSGDTYGIYSSNVSLGTGNNYNFYAYGNATNYFQGNVGVGVGTKSSTEKLAVAGAVELLTTTAPNSTTNKLYNTSGNLFWNGTQLNNSSSNEFIDGGNSFGAIATLGTNDGYGLAIETNGTERMTINSSGKVGIGALTPSANLHVKSSSAGEIFKLESTESGTQSGPDVNLYRNSSSPADDDFLGRFVYKGENSIGDIIEYGQIKAQIGDVTSTDEGFNMFFQGMVNGTNRSFLGLRANDGGGIADQAEVTINENSIDMDFRIESDIYSHAFFVRGTDSKVGIGVSSPATPLAIMGNGGT